MNAAERRVVAVMSADVAGYTALMEADEDGTHDRMSRLGIAAIDPSMAEYHGRIVKHTGDGFVATFESVIDATSCAIALQQGFSHIGAEPGRPPIKLRLGLNVANVIVEPHDVFGAGVNLAARLQAIAEPGGIVVSSNVAEELRGWPGIELADLGALRLKNLRRRVRAFGVRARGVVPTLHSQDTVAAGHDRPSIAVLPLRQSPPSPEDAYFADGISEGIIHGLAGLPELFVISHGSASAFSDYSVNAVDAGRALGVRYVVEGTFHRFRERVRIATRLIDVDDGGVLHTSQFDGETAELFDIQDRISAEVIATIAPSVHQRELSRAVRKPPQSQTAYDCVLRSLDLMPRLDRSHFDLAGAWLNRAIEEDSEYALAWSYLAFWHLIHVAQGWSANVSDDIAKAERAAETALTHDPRNSTALAIRGHFLSYAQRDFVGATSLLERAVEIGPNNPMAWSLSSATSGYMGQSERAIQQAQKAIRLSPIDPFGYLSEYLLGQAYYLSGNFSEAVRICRRVAAQNGMHAANLRTLTASLVAAGDTSGAEAIARRILAINPRFRISVFALQTPLTGVLLEQFRVRLRVAGLPD